jgi:D-amino-acid dehydrogenase
MSTKVVVVGGGIAGLSCAYYLRRREFDVTVVESNRIGSGASFANGGWLCPAQAGPLPEPGLTLYGMRTFLDRDSALYFQPAYFPRLAPWLLRFWTYCNERDHAHGTSAIARLGHDIFDLVEQMRADGVECELYKQGMVFAARSADDARAELRKLAPMREHGYDLPDDIVTDAELHELEPALSETVRAGFQIREHWHVRPDSITAGLADVLRRDGVDIREGAEVVELVQQGNRLTTVRTAAGDVEADIVVLAAGAWTTELARSLGTSLPMEPGKGYSFYARPEVMPSHAILLADVHVGCTPYGDRIRIGGTMEFSGVNTRLDRRRIGAIVTGAKESFVPWKSGEIESEWAGMRPIPADGLPIVDRFGSFENTYVTTGHGMQGMTLAPPSGHALAEMIATGQRPPLLEPFRLDRFPRIALRRVGRRPGRAA